MAQMAFVHRKVGNLSCGISHRLMIGRQALKRSSLCETKAKCERPFGFYSHIDMRVRNKRILSNSPVGAYSPDNLKPNSRIHRETVALYSEKEPVERLPPYRSWDCSSTLSIWIPSEDVVFLWYIPCKKLHVLTICNLMQKAMHTRKNGKRDGIL